MPPTRTVRDFENLVEHAPGNEQSAVEDELPCAHHDDPDQVNSMQVLTVLNSRFPPHKGVYAVSATNSDDRGTHTWRVVLHCSKTCRVPAKNAIVKGGTVDCKDGRVIYKMIQRNLRSITGFRCRPMGTTWWEGRCCFRFELKQLHKCQCSATCVDEV